MERWVAAGPIQRQPCDDDSRGHLITATQAGFMLHQSMWPAYADAIDRAVGAKLSADEHGQLAALLGRLIHPASAVASTGRARLRRVSRREVRQGAGE